MIQKRSGLYGSAGGSQGRAPSIRSYRDILQHVLILWTGRNGWSLSVSALLSCFFDVLDCTWTSLDCTWTCLTVSVLKKLFMTFDGRSIDSLYSIQVGQCGYSGGIEKLPFSELHSSMSDASLHFAKMKSSKCFISSTWSAIYSASFRYESK